MDCGMRWIPFFLCLGSLSIACGGDAMISYVSDRVTIMTGTFGQSICTSDVPNGSHPLVLA